METNTHERALVLGGGGSLGNAWLIGIIAGLAERGLDVTNADLLVGTSAGATAAAQIAAAEPAGLYESILTTPIPPTRPGPSGGPASNQHMIGQLERTNAMFRAASDPEDLRRRVGTAAIEQANGDPGDRWRSIVAGRLPSTDWPDRDVRITAVHAPTGEPVTFDRDSGVSLVDAVAASTAGGPAHRIGDEWYVDGGYWRGAENAQLAAGYARVLVLSPLGARTRAPLEWGMHLAAQTEELVATGSRVEAVLPDEASLESFDENMMNLSQRPAAARAGFAQGQSTAGALSEFWG